MTVPDSFVDAVEAVRAWINGVPGLTGAGTTLPLGAHRWREVSPGEGAYALIVYAGGSQLAGDGTFASQAFVSATVFAGTSAAARVGAVDLLNAMAALDYSGPVTVTLETDGTQAIVEAIDNITGPNDLHPATGDMAFLVSGAFTLIPNP